MLTSKLIHFSVFYDELYHLICIFLLVWYIAIAIPYFIMGRKAGYRHAWIAFLPLGKIYLALKLPHRDFKILWFRSKQRMYLFTTLIVVGIVCHVISFPFRMLLFFPSQSPIDDILPSLILIMALIGLAFYVVYAFITRRMNYDLLKTYKLEKHVVWAPIVNIFCPLVMVVFSFIIMNREPEYGFGEFYCDRMYE